VHVAIDSYNDKRTAFQFGVNPRGVKQDTYRYDDTRRDPDWDAVWDVATTVDPYGWTAEFRIPYTQLRFPHAEEVIWGIQFTRDIARKKELVYWAPLSSQESGTVIRWESSTLSATSEHFLTRQRRTYSSKSSAWKPRPLGAWMKRRSVFFFLTINVKNVRIVLSCGGNLSPACKCGLASNRL